MRRFYAPKENFSGSLVSLDNDETRHLRNVLRLRVGDEVSVFDGLGHEFRCRIDRIEKKLSELEIIEETKPASLESPLEIIIAAAILKHDRFDLVIQKAVELGVSTIVPLHTVRLDVRPDSIADRKQRWQRIALEATKQSGRAKLIQISESINLDTFIEASKKEVVVMFSERDGGPFSDIKPNGKITAIVGPVGGWDDSELEFARSKSVHIVTLGGRVLRAETASISIATILQHRFGDLN